jgi:hypothetical protein
MYTLDELWQMTRILIHRNFGDDAPHSGPFPEIFASVLRLRGVTCGVEIRNNAAASGLTRELLGKLAFIPMAIFRNVENG